MSRLVDNWKKQQNTGGKSGQKTKFTKQFCSILIPCAFHFFAQISVYFFLCVLVYFFMYLSLLEILRETEMCSILTPCIPSVDQVKV